MLGSFVSFCTGEIRQEAEMIIAINPGEGGASLLQIFDCIQQCRLDEYIIKCHIVGFTIQNLKLQKTP